MSLKNLWLTALAIVHLFFKSIYNNEEIRSYASIGVDSEKFTAEYIPFCSLISFSSLSVNGSFISNKK
jgi:hypothetical protein